MCVSVWCYFFSASARLFKHTCSIILLCTPWHYALALDLLTSFPDCYNHPSELSMASNIMVIHWGHCCQPILQQTSQEHMKQCSAGSHACLKRANTVYLVIYLCYFKMYFSCIFYYLHCRYIFTWRKIYEWCHVPVRAFSTSIHYHRYGQYLNDKSLWI